MTEYVAKDIAELTGAIVQITRNQGNSRPWCRGHADGKWPLIPSLYRRGLHSKENNINALFRMKAKPRYTNCPAAIELILVSFLLGLFGYFGSAMLLSALE